MRLALVLGSMLMLLAACPGEPTPAVLRPCPPHGFTTPGEKLPDCTFEGFNGSPNLHLTELKGKPAVLNFWASWCIDCIKEMPTFQKVYASLGGKVTFVGMDVLGIQGETAGAGRAFAKRTGVHYPLAFDPQGLLYGHFSNRTLLPTTVFVDAHGVVKERHYGALDESELRQAIKTYFNIT